jgi:hypothetical protein
MLVAFVSSLGQSVHGLQALLLNCLFICKCQLVFVGTQESVCAAVVICWQINGFFTLPNASFENQMLLGLCGCLTKLSIMLSKELFCCSLSFASEFLSNCL